MDDSQPLSMLTRRKTYLVRGPRPCSWMSSSPNSPLNEHRGVWPWPIRPKLSRESTLRSTTSTESSGSSTSTSSSLVHTPSTLVGYSEEPYCRRVRRRKPAGPRAPRNSSCFVRPGLLINTSLLPVTPQLLREISPTTPAQCPVMPQSPQVPPLTAINSPTNFPLDWDAIFEILGCSEALLDGGGSW